MKEIKEIYDQALELMKDCNESFKDLPEERLNTLNILLTGIISNINQILTDSVKNANNLSASPEKTGSGDK